MEVIGNYKALVVLATLFMAGACAQPTTEESVASGSEDLTYVVEASWPKPLPNQWILGQVAGVAVGSQGHVWIIHRPRTLTARETGAVQKPPLSGCCYPAPSVIEFDQKGNLLQAWGGPSWDPEVEGGWVNPEGGWPEKEHGIFVDHEDNVWIGSYGELDHVALKFSRDGQLLLTIGVWGETGGSNDTQRLGKPTNFFVDPEANEVYISDGYLNRRIIVFDAMTGEYKRHWGAYGEPPNDEPLGPYDPDTPPARSFRNPMHAVRISNDGSVYTADRVNNRIQVFQKSGEFVTEAFVAPRTLAMGSVWDLDFSPDEEQTYLFVPDGTNMKVWILARNTLKVVGEFGRGGRQAGQFNWVHSLSVDSQGNIYTSEVKTGNRIQKFVRAEAF